MNIEAGKWLRVDSTGHYFDEGEREPLCRMGVRRYMAKEMRFANTCRKCRMVKHNREDHPTTLVVGKNKILVEVPRAQEV